MWGKRDQENQKLFKACEDEEAPDIQKCQAEWAEKNFTQETYVHNNGQTEKLLKMKMPFTHGRAVPIQNPASGAPAGR